MASRIHGPIPGLFTASALCLAALSCLPVMASSAELSKPAQAALTQQKFKPLRQLQKNALAPGHIASPRDAYEVAYDLYIRYTDGTIYNPTTKQYDQVKLRAYQQKTDKGWDAKQAKSDGSGAFAAPAVVMEPGQTVRFKLHNQLPIQVPTSLTPPALLPSVFCDPTLPNAPGYFQCFNITNLHSHGLWVSPTGNSDNVLLSINPSVNFEYEYNVPVTHPAGTFWYHPHVHGSTAMQVASGMTGALIVYGERAPTDTINGDLDTLLKPMSPKATAVDEVLMFQQIPYACDVTSTSGASGGTPVNWNCQTATNKVGVVENFNQTNGWPKSGRFTSVNGQVLPTFELQANAVHRWRLIGAGFGATIVFRIGKANNQEALANYINRNTPATAIDLNAACTGSAGFDVTQFEVASDGLTHAQAIAKTSNYLQPGYRSDILFTLPESGLYCVYSQAAPVSGVAQPVTLLGVANATPAKSIVEGCMDGKNGQTVCVKTQLKNAALQVYPAGTVQTQVIADLNVGNTNPIQLNKFVPHRPISDAEIAASAQPVIPIKFNFTSLPQINNQSFDPNVINQTMILGKAQTWKLSSVNGSHPFHIHVNPFEIVKITYKNGAAPDPQYAGMEGTWRDTVMVTPDVDIEVRTRYQRYIGQFVLHCHILSHEDQGMMQYVQVVLPDENGQPSSGAHGGHGAHK